MNKAARNKSPGGPFFSRLRALFESEAARGLGPSCHRAAGAGGGAVNDAGAGAGAGADDDAPLLPRATS